MKRKNINHGTIFGTSMFICNVESEDRRMSLFRCDCGKEFITRTSRVISGETKGCGCRKGQNLPEIVKNNHPRLRHGFTKKSNKNPEYPIWNAMLSRCNNPKNNAYSRYGGRGIKVCERWLDFVNFISDVGRRPSKIHSLERMNNDGNYCPENVKWGTPDEQRSNRSDNRLIEYHGIVKPLFLLAREFNIKPSVIHKRLKRGWDLEKSLTLPTGSRI